MPGATMAALALADFTVSIGYGIVLPLLPGLVVVGLAVFARTLEAKRA